MTAVSRLPRGIAAPTQFASSVDGGFAWLGYINLLVLCFNLLPALPLDGGGIFRSTLWRIKGDFTWATRIAATVGVAIGALMIATGLLSSFSVVPSAASGSCSSGGSFSQAPAARTEGIPVDAGLS